MAEWDTCPKAMHYGPCGGVLADGRCEVGDRACPFVLNGSVWRDPDFIRIIGGPTPTARSAAFPSVIVDVREPPGFRGDPNLLWRNTASTLTGVTALIGEHVDHRADDAGRLDVGEVVSLFAEQEVGCIVTVTGRDRTMVDAQREIEHLHQVGALAVHCVTGDHPAALGIDRPATWGAECFDLIAAVVSVGAVATAGESPTSPGPRVARLIAKERAGATALILNHGGNIADLIEFADRCRDAGATAPLIAPVPVVVDAQSAEGLSRFPGLRLPDGLLAAVAAAANPRRVGIARAVGYAAEALASGRFAGINLSGPARVSNADERLDITAELLDALREV